MTEISDVHDVTVTAYSSTPEETDDTPFTTATGNTVRDGIVATNILDFGTRVQIPELFGDKVFVVDDRMHPRKTKNVDVWMPTKSDALRFGIRHAMVVVLK
ncbi:MAG: 3D domain-containing protein [Candidatus Liptonbacteria bacterium]|nr:3D domain-containing protein [Candidatus Liptonbacteria bacterium]